MNEKDAFFDTKTSCFVSKEIILFMETFSLVGYDWPSAYGKRIVSLGRVRNSKC